MLKVLLLCHSIKVTNRVYEEDSIGINLLTVGAFVGFVQQQKK